LSGLIDTVRELRALTGCGLAVALGYVREGWKIGDPIDQSLLTSRDEAQVAKHRLERAAPALLEALQLFSREYDGFEDGDGQPCPVLAKARAAITAATHPAQAPVEEE
jgi:hypothetical protein